MKDATKFSSPSFLRKIDFKFLESLDKNTLGLIKKKRSIKEDLTSEEILFIAPLLENFLIKFLKIENPYKDETSSAEKISLVKRSFIQRNISINPPEIQILKPRLKFKSEMAFAEMVLAGKNIEKCEEYAKFALFSEEGRLKHKDGILFKIPKKLTKERLFKFDELKTGEIDYTDYPSPETDENALWQAKYCIYCAKQKKDYCRKGNPKGILETPVSGCPLNQKISEMNLLKAGGGLISPLAVAMIDNPLIILTGHRICNDCKKACIFQKQENVDVPLLESKILKDVLNLPFGFEIYFLLTKWNPLLTQNFLPSSLSKRGRILVAGAGAAGIACAYYFLKEGFSVTMIDASSILSLKTDLIENVNDILSEKNRIPTGFGGVMEYGITDRWNKNFLKLAQILLQRNSNFRVFGSTRFGSDITFKSAKERGFLHVCVCIGAGSPNVPVIKNNNVDGVFTASNFLMSLQLSDAKWAVSKLKSPVCVIGAGLTAFDAAMEARKLGAEVSIFYRSNIQASPSYKLNDFEIEIALKAGIKFFQNKVLKEIIIKNNHVHSLSFEDGFELKANTLIFATGTKPNTFPLKGEDKYSKFHTNFGDVSDSYAGSVVKAIASVKNNYQKIISELPKETTLLKNTDKFYHKVHSLNFKNGLYILEVKASFESNCRPLNIFKLQISSVNAGPVHLTLFKKTKNILKFYVQSSKLKDLKKGDLVNLMQGSDNLKNIPIFSKIYVDDKRFIMALEESFMGKVFSVKDFKEENAPILFYVREKSLIPKLKLNNYFIFLFTEMNCMMGGICSRCLIFKEDGTSFFACEQNIRPLSLL
jgi:NADPH-dependent glutamate synthase beta subunit-like oxidoreductase